MTVAPILFTAPMVRAILNGTKTQTRRVVRPQPDGVDGATWAERDGLHAPCEDLLCRGMLDAIGAPIMCPYGIVGGHIWVRETWRTEEVADVPGLDVIRFAADNAFVPIANTREAADAWVDAHDNGKHETKWRPSIFMRRWMSRITLAITDVRVERVQSIGEADAIAEGIVPLMMDGGSAIPVYEGLWDSINGKRPGCAWASNPWVWVLTFRRVQC